MAQIKRFGVLQTAKLAAIMYFLVTAIVALPVGLITILAAPDTEGRAGPVFRGVVVLLAPLPYAVMGFVCVAIVCFIYNFIAKHEGGIEIEIE
jgi:hypothetical protein